MVVSSKRSSKSPVTLNALFTMSVGSLLPRFSQSSTFLLMVKFIARTAVALAVAKAAVVAANLTVTCVAKNGFSAMYDGVELVVAPTFDKKPAVYFTKSFKTQFNVSWFSIPKANFSSTFESL